MILAIFVVLLALVMGFGAMLYGFMWFLNWYKKREDERKEGSGRR